MADMKVDLCIRMTAIKPEFKKDAEKLDKSNDKMVCQSETTMGEKEFADWVNKVKVPVTVARTAKIIEPKYEITPQKF